MSFFFDNKFITKLQVHFETFFKDPKFFKFWKVSPSVIRPSIASDVRQGTNEDDLTTSLMHIIQLNNTIENGIENGKDISGVQGRVGWCWEVIQAQHALMINSQESEWLNFRLLWKIQTLDLFSFQRLLLAPYPQNSDPSSLLDNL